MGLPQTVLLTPCWWRWSESSRRARDAQHSQPAPSAPAQPPSVAAPPALEPSDDMLKYLVDQKPNLNGATFTGLAPGARLSGTPSFAATGPGSWETSRVSKRIPCSRQKTWSLRWCCRRLSTMSRGRCTVARVAQREELRVPERVAWTLVRCRVSRNKEFSVRGWRVYEPFTNAAER
jgi:hypothetical protein